MTTVSVVVPWRSDNGGQRDRIWSWCRRWWIENHPEWTLNMCDTYEAEFTRGRALNAGAACVHGDVLVLADADTIASGVDEAVRIAVEHGWSIAYPEGMYLALTEAATERLLTSDPAASLTAPQKADIRQQITSYSGVIAITREAWDTVGGFDPRFRSWGAEDLAFYFALETMVGPCHRAGGFALAPYHPHIESERFNQPHFKANETLCHRYQAVYGNRSAMRALIEEAKAWTSA